MGKIFSLKYSQYFIYFINLFFALFLFISINNSIISTITTFLFIFSILFFIIFKIFHYRLIFKASNFFVISILFIYTLFIFNNYLYLILVFLLLLLDGEMFSFLVNISDLLTNYKLISESDKSILRKNISRKFFREFFVASFSAFISVVLIASLRPIEIFNPLFSVFVFLILSIFLVYYLKRFFL